MERYSCKRGASETIAPKKGRNVGFKNASTSTDDRNAQFCNRIGCSGRIKYNTQNTKIGTSGKAKSSNKPSFASGFDLLESSQSGDSETKELISSSSRNFTRHGLGSKNKAEEVVMTAKNGSSSSTLNIKPRKAFHHKSEPSNKNNTQSDFSSFVPSNSKSSSLRTLNSSNNSSSSSSSSNNSSSSSSFGMRNLKCNSISESKSAGKNVTKKKNPESESSFSRRGPHKGHICPSRSGVSISDSGRSHFASGDSKSGGSIRTRRPTDVVNKGRTRLSYQQNGRNGSSLREPSLRISQLYDSGSGSSSGSSSYSRTSSNSGNQPTMTRFNAGNREQYNMDGITEVLLAIERLEHNEELTREQMLTLEANLFLSGLNRYDQHRDMRLDIDNMSYEELLALEERMGTVSTALSEEALIKCIKKSTYDAGPPEVRATGSGEDGDDIKCSICQEEYALGDETGKLVECRHGFHLTCINRWLRLKNWCPICKASVAPQE